MFLKSYKKEGAFSVRFFCDTLYIYIDVATPFSKECLACNIFSIDAVNEWNGALHVLL